jgi:hypothetical protein
VESRGLSVGKVGESDMESQHHQDCIPCLCQLRTDGLAPQAIIEQEPSSWLSTEACLFSTTLFTIVGEKLGMDPQTSKPSCCGLGRQPFFSWVVGLFKSVDDYMKGCYALTMRDTYGLGPCTD